MHAYSAIQILPRSNTMRRIFYYATLAAGVAAAFLMYRRGASLTDIAKNTIINPVGSFVNEVKS
jgi:hypothetical protein